MELLIEFVNEGDSRGDVQIDDIGVGDAIEMLHQRAEAVSVPGDEDGLAGFHRRRYLILPIREEPRTGILEALRGRELFRRHMFVAGIMAGVPWVLDLERGRPDIVAAPP